MDSIQGKVLSVHSAGRQARAVLEVRSSIVCRRCAEGKGCGAALFGNTASTRRIEATIAAGIDVQAGQYVQLSLPSGRLLQAALYAWGLPLLAALLATLTAGGLALTEGKAVVLVLTALLAGVLFARQRLSQPACLQHFKPQVTALAGSG